MDSKKVKLISDSSSDSDEGFQVNENYANKYDKWRHKEELQKLKAKYGDGSPSSSSSSESEDDIPVIEKDFLKTLSLLKSKDPKIYDENQKFFADVAECKLKPKEQKEKPLYLKDYERKQLLETGGKLDSENEDIDIGNSQTYNEEQEEIKDSFKKALADSDSEESETELLKVREKNLAEKAEDEADYIQWLKGEKKDFPEEKLDKDLNFLHDYWNNPSLDNDEGFLKNYILNKQYIENNEDNKIPTYEEITNDLNTFSDDEDILQQQEIFEHKYNFRFEEPDSEFIKQYPRTIGDSLRRVDNKRKLQRENYQERKRKEKEQKKEEIKRLKALKRMEIENMMNKLKETTGNEQLGFNYTDIEGDFDPEEHDKRMKKLFNDEYYEVDETEKPEFPSDEELDNENWDNWTWENNQVEYDADGPHCEDPDFNMDVDYDPKLAFQHQMIESQSKKSKKKRRKSKFAETLSKPKPIFNPTEKTLEQYVDEYYKMDFEDIIGGEVFRFKYRNVVPNNFGLSTDEILKARDKELNKWCSLKKTCQHRSEEEEKYDIIAYESKSKNLNSKKKLLPSLFENTESSDVTSVSSPDKNTKRKKHKDDLLTTDITDVNNFYEPKRTKVKKSDDFENRISEINQKGAELLVDSNNLSNQNTSSAKRKRKKKKKAKIIGSDNVVVKSESTIVKRESDSNSQINTNSNVTKKKRKNKVSYHNMQNHASTTPIMSKSFNSKTGERNSQVRSKLIDDKRLQLSDARLKAYGINPKKYKNRIKYSALNKDM